MAGETEKLQAVWESAWIAAHKAEELFVAGNDGGDQAAALRAAWEKAKETETAAYVRYVQSIAKPPR